MQDAILTEADILTLSNFVHATSEIWNGTDYIIDHPEVIAWFNAPADPAVPIWREKVTRSEIYNNTSSDATDWSWTIYKAQGVPEQNAWVQMFMGDEANFTKPNLRAGIGNIFGGSNNNTLHALAIGERPATRFEAVFATGTGIKVSSQYGKQPTVEQLITAGNLNL